MHVLLTGASGFLGGVCLHLLSSDPNITVTPLRSGRAPRSLGVSSEQIHSSIAGSPDEIVSRCSALAPTHIIHCGALSSPDRCEQEPQVAHASNVEFTQVLCAIAQATGAHVTTVSTDLVFDGGRAPSGGLDEQATPIPSSVYSKTKLEAERLTLQKTNGAVVRLSLMYGRSPSVSQGVMGWMEDTLRRGERLPLFFDEYRTPLHVQDAARAVLACARNTLRGVWHCGGPRRLSRVEFGTLVAEACGYTRSLITPTSRLEHPGLPRRPEDVSLNSTKLWSALATSPLDVQEALARYDNISSSSTTA